MATAVRVIDISTDELRALVEGAVATALKAKEPTDAGPLLTVAQVAQLTRTRKATVIKAAVSGALKPATVNAKARGRSPRWLFERKRALAWQQAGRPLRG